jgi:choline monooxygenase
VAAPGAFFTANIAGEPVVVVRGEDSELRAFYNVCRHRAAQVMNERCGTASRLRCRYHGWTYDLAGQLKGVPEFEGVEEFSREEQGLLPVAVQTLGPLVFVSLAKEPTRLEEFLAPTPVRALQSLSDVRFFQRKSFELECNWKVFVDNYLDGGYHIHTVHPGLASVIDYSQYRVELFDNASVQSTPLKPPAAKKDDGVTGGVRRGTRAEYFWVFPNLMMNVYEGILDTNVVWPISPSRCRVDFDFYFADGVGDAAFRQQSVDVANRIQAEDTGVCEEVQRGLASRSYETGRFSVKREAAGYHFHKLLARCLRDGLDAEARRDR